MLVSRPQDVSHRDRVPEGMERRNIVAAPPINTNSISGGNKKRSSLIGANPLVTVADASPSTPTPNASVSTSASSAVAKTRTPGFPSNSPLSPFNRFRPSSHFMAPKGWMNDPAGPCFDGEKHHLFYECNPKGSTWGNMSWGHATAPTLAGPWTHDCDKGNPVLGPSAPYDCEGIFTGCVLTHGPHGEPGMMTAIYTAVSSLPIHWSRTYDRGCEKLALATSHDNGRTWRRDVSRNPILPGPPLGIEVKSWRDPFVAVWHDMDEALGSEKGIFYYGLIAGSVPDVGPRLFLYRIPRNDLSSWTFISTLGDGVDFNAALPGGAWTGEFGRNWEVGMFFGLPSKDEKERARGKEEQYILLNVEGCDRAAPARHPMWLSCDVSTKDEEEEDEKKPRLEMKTSGQLDWGCAYAASSFKDVATGRTMMWSWITEDDLPERYYDVQGWSGVMALPRELYQMQIKGVVGSIKSSLEDIGSIKADKDEDGAYTISTLGMRPGQEVERLRVGAIRRCENLCFDIYNTSSPSSSSSRILKTLPITSRSWELQTTLDIDVSKTQRVGLILAHNADFSQQTVVYFEPSREVMGIDRRRSTTLDEEIKKEVIEGPFTLFNLASSSSSAAEAGDGGGQRETVHQEPLHLRLFCDNSVLELFVNDRWACATRIYPDDPTSVGLSFFVEPKDQPEARTEEDSRIVRVERLDLWEGLASAFTPPAAL